MTAGFTSQPCFFLVLCWFLGMCRLQWSYKLTREINDWFTFRSLLLTLHLPYPRTYLQELRISCWGVWKLSLRIDRQLRSSYSIHYLRDHIIRDDNLVLFIVLYKGNLLVFFSQVAQTAPNFYCIPNSFILGPSSQFAFLTLCNGLILNSQICFALNHLFI